jgi:hypothetical protein
MAFITKDLVNMGTYNGFNFWRYDTLEASTAVDAAGYFNNSDDTQIIQVGDLMFVVDWDTAIRSGTVAGLGLHIVNQNSSGAIDMTDNLLNASFADSD